jgi:hypothetical protein
MKTRNKIAFFLYMINSILSLVFGFRYLLCDTIMPYHQQAIGMKWVELGPGLQLLLNSQIKVIAAAFFVTSISSVILLLIPFRKGERWAIWSIAIIQILFLSFILYVPVNIYLHTQASTPWPFSVAALALSVIAFLLSKTYEN